MTEQMVPLRILLEEKIDGLRREGNVRYDSTQLAIDKAEKGMQERLSSMNEFRSQLKDQAGSFATNVSVDEKLAAHAAIVEKLEDVVKAQGERLSNFDGRWLVLAGVLTAVQGLIAIVLKTWVSK